MSTFRDDPDLRVESLADGRRCDQEIARAEESELATCGVAAPGRRSERHQPADPASAVDGGELAADEPAQAVTDDIDLV